MEEEEPTIQEVPQEAHEEVQRASVQRTSEDATVRGSEETPAPPTEADNLEMSDEEKKKEVEAELLAAGDGEMRASGEFIQQSVEDEDGVADRPEAHKRSVEFERVESDLQSAEIQEESMLPDLEPEYEIDELPEIPAFEKSKSLLDIESKGSLDKDKIKATEKKKLRVLGSIISIRRGNQDLIDRQKIPKYMNSYKLESDKPFNIEKVENIIKEVLQEALENLTYFDTHHHSDHVPKQAKWASSAIRAKIKEQDYDRYKIVCIVTIGEKRSQDIYTMFRVLWDTDRDKYALYTHENMHVYAIGLCFGLYYE